LRQLKIVKQITQRSEEGISQYFQEVSKYPLLTAEEEVDLSVRIQNDDEEALKKLVTSNLRFVISVAKKYQFQGLSFSDLINEGNMGLVKAARKFDETKGFKFISYAVWWIRQGITQAISEQTRVVRLPLNRVSSISKITKAIPHLEQEFEREPTDSEIADYLHYSNQKVEVANNIKNRHTSFDMPLKKEGEENLTLYDKVHCDNIPSPDNELMQESVEQDISRALSKLSWKESEILTLSYGLGKTKALSLHHIALKFDMSTERIRQLKQQALKKLKTLLKGNATFQDY
jgi:RNA polymerase primary sigma factor